MRTREAMQRAQQSSEPTTIPITIGSPKPQPRSLVLVGTADSVYGSSHSVHGSQLVVASPHKPRSHTQSPGCPARMSSLVGWRVALAWHGGGGGSAETALWTVLATAVTLPPRALMSAASAPSPPI